MGFKDLPGGKNDKNKKAAQFAGELAPDKTAKASDKQPKNNP